MDRDELTVEQSLDALSEAVGKAADDLRATQARLDQQRVDIVSRNTSVTRDVVRTAERAIDRLREADEALSDVFKELDERD
jgi:hypothetical protein